MTNTPDHWFGRTTSAKTMTAILEAHHIPKAVLRTYKGMFGGRQRVLVRPRGAPVGPLISPTAPNPVSA